MSDRPPPGASEPPVPDDPFLAEDPAAREREARRRERERRRAERAARDAEPQGPQDEQPPSERERPAPRAPTGPSPAERASAAISGLGERISQRRAERERARAEARASTSAVSEAPRETSGDGVGTPPRARPPREPAPPRRSLVDRLPRPGPLLIVLALAAVAILVFLNALFQPFHGGGEGRVLFKVPKGASAGAVADLLDEEGVVSSGTLFELRLTIAGRRGDIFAGTYSLARGMSYSDAIGELTKPPSQRTLPITVPEGYSREQIARIATDAGLDGSYERESRRAKGFDPSEYGAGGAETLEGFLYPATYELRPSDTAADLVSEQLAAFEREFKKVDLDGEAQDLTPYEVLTIASMIDREVMIARERELVSSVIHNRLETGEPLGIDATIRYATGNYDRPLTQSELAIDSPYNTRENAGLPPTPIGNPGLAAIKAAANPAETDFHYYVVKPGTCGEHEFVETQEEFDAATARYDSAREAAGGKSPDTC